MKDSARPSAAEVTANDLRRQAAMIEARAENNPDCTGDSLSEAYKQADALEARADATLVADLGRNNE